MNSSEVQCFMISAELLSFTKAAERLYLTRQAVSKRVLSLEKELNNKLFIRNSQTLLLTEAGKLYYEFFQNTQTRWERLQANLMSLHQKSSTLDVSYLEGLNMPPELLDVLFSVRDQYNVALQLSTYDMHNLNALVENGAHDLILCYGGPRLKMYREYEYVPVASYGMVLVAHNNLFREIPNASISNFEHFPMITWLRKDQTVEEALSKCAQCCSDFGFHCQEIRVVSNRETARAEIEAGHGVGICTSIDRLANSPVIRTLSLHGTSTLVCMWKRNTTSPAVRAVVQKLQQSEYSSRK